MRPSLEPERYVRAVVHGVLHVLEMGPVTEVLEMIVEAVSVEVASLQATVTSSGTGNA